MFSHNYDCEICDTSCDDCGYTRGIKYELTLTEFNYTYVDQWTHIRECKHCGVSTEEMHSPDGFFHYNTSQHYICCRECRTNLEYEEHIFSDQCDTKCDTCLYQRTTTHQYTNDCDNTCNVCGYTRTTSHQYTNDCDNTCNVCGATRTNSHTYTNNCDTSCNVCGATRTVASHTFNKYNSNFVGHWKICSICGEKESDVVESHTITQKEYFNKDWHKSTCTVCDAEIAFDHVYENDCDATCNDCTYKRNVSHEYTDSCDKACNKCNEERAVVHTYTDICDEECNVCGEKRTDCHAYGEWTVVTGATCTTEGTKSKICYICSVEKEEKIAKLDHKLSASQDGNNIKHECLECNYSYTTPIENISGTGNNNSNTNDNSSSGLSSAEAAKIQQYRETTIILGGSMIIGLTMMGLVSGLARRRKGKSKKDD